MKTSDKKEDKNGWKKHEPKKDEEKKTFFPIIDGQNPRYPYTQVKEILYEYMRWSGKYKHNLSLILEMLEEEKEIDPDTKIPKQKVSTKLDKDKAAAENTQFEIKYKIELKKHYEKISHLEDEQHTFCADIMKMCHDKMTEKIRKEPDYTTLKLKPLELLARIKKKMTQTDKTEHEFSNLWDTIERLVMCKMRKKDGKKESLHAYKKRMTAAIAGLKSILGEKKHSMGSQRIRNGIRIVLHKQKERNARVNHLRPSLRLPSSKISIKGSTGAYWKNSIKNMV